VSKKRKGPAARAPAATPAAPASASPRPGTSRLGRGVAIAAAALAVAGVVALVVVQRSVTPGPPSTTPRATVTGAAAQAAQHVGKTVCAECHGKESAAWRGSDHDLAMQVADDTTVLGDFANAKFTYAGTTSTFSRRDGKFVVTTDGPDGKLADSEVRYAFGVRPLQQYLIELPGGRMQALSIAWDSRPKAEGGQRWFHLYPGQDIKAGDWLHWTAGGQNWNFMCAECHSTNLRKNFDATAQKFATTWSELNVSCEACHGPGSAHVGWARKQGDWKALDVSKGLAIALDERRGVQWLPVAGSGTARRSAPRTSNREIDTCARCHGRSARLSDDYVHGRSPQDTHRLVRLDPGLYWPDGQMRDEVYNWGSFMQSKMHAQGVTCSDCHDPHSLKLKAPGNAVCAQCHQPARFDVPQHTHHAAGTPGAACASCHMPTTTYMVVDPRHDHSMRIPRPDLSVQLGTPNACTNCHAKQSAQWAADAVARWTGKAPAGFQRFGPAFHAGSSGAPGARGALLALIDDKAQPPLVRASAIDRLRPWMTPTLLPAVTRALNDPDASVRLAAVENLAAADQPTRVRYLPRMLGDPVRAVRIEAARALVGPPESGLLPDQRALFDAALAEYVAVQRYNADRPEGRSGLAQVHAARGDAQAAIAEYRKALDIDPGFVPAYVNLSDLYRVRGADGEAEALLREGIARNPAAAALHHALGLALVRQKKTAEALRELTDAARLAPDDARFAYVRAVALHDAGQPREAMKVLESALARHPYDRDLLAALASYSAQAGALDVARGHARTLVELDPENPEYAELAAQLAGKGVRR
jgi:Flp pilus assembly protein TadD